MIGATWRRLRMAVALLTRIPVAYPPDARDDDIGPSAAMYPIVGVAVGAVTIGAYYGAAAVWDGTAMPVAAAIVAWIAVTGGLHLDGLMDAADGLFSHRPRSDKLRIMKDPQVGAFGAVALAVVLILKAASLSAVPPHRVWKALLMAPMFGRLGMVYAGAAYPYARPEGGMGGAFAERVWWTHVGVAAFTTLVACTLVRDVRVWAALLACGVFTFWAARRMARSLGGLTGDTYGALCEAPGVVAPIASGGAAP